MAIESAGLLDDLGYNLLSILQKDARISYAELGRRIGLSPAATAERMRRMEEAGIIRGYRVDIDREALGFQVLAIVRLSCDGPKYRPFLNAVKSMDLIAECHHVPAAMPLSSRWWPRPWRNWSAWWKSCSISASPLPAWSSPPRWWAR